MNFKDLIKKLLGEAPPAPSGVPAPALSAPPEAAPKTELPKQRGAPRTWRQGDVFVIETKFVPYGLKIRPPVLAEGEVTGHAHRLQANTRAQVGVTAGGAMYLTVEDEAATILHEEHGPITVPKGIYEVRIQREYHPQEIRRVVD